MKAQLLLVAALLGAAISPLPAATVTVTTTNDSGPGSLRDALAGVANGDVIDATGITGTIALNGGQLLVTNSVQIVGPGPDVLALDASAHFPNTTYRVFDIGQGMTVTIFGLTIKNGHLALGGQSGAGIYNDHATLTVSNCTISGNLLDGTGGSGAGIFNFGGTLTVVSSTLRGNTANSSTGGGISSAAFGGRATLVVIASTLSGNHADGGGAGIDNVGAGGTATVQIVNSTLSGNSAPASGPNAGGIRNTGIFSGGRATLTCLNSTFSGNDPVGIVNQQESGNGRVAITQIGSTILKAGSGANLVNYQNVGTITSLGYNLSSDNGGGFLTATGDQINTDPMLGPLQNNGGPTFTHALTPCSPAIGVGNPSFTPPPSFDQRGPGFPRVVGGSIDIGAFEMQSGSVRTTADSGLGSLRAALASTTDGDTITFCPTLTGTITLTSGELVVSNSVSIVGPGSGLLAVDGNAAGRVFHVQNGVTATISSLTITNGLADGQFPANTGGGILNDHATLTVSNSTLTGNSADNGGGIGNDGAFGGSATLTVVNSTLNGNLAFTKGGGIINEALDGSATLSVVNSTLTDNRASNVVFGIYGEGGGIYNEGFSGNASLQIANSTLSGNLAKGEGAGGGIHNSGNAMLEIGNTVLNTGASGANIQNISGTITSLGYNLSSDDGSGFLTATGDQTNTNPMLGPLQNNGGPTQTHALTAGSPAIDKGKNLSTSAADQRGQPRTFDDPDIANASGGDGTDIGAYEISELHMTAVDKLGNDLRLSFTSVLGTNYEVQSRPDLTSGTWGSLPGSTPGNGGIAQTTVTNALSETQQFYRVHLLP